MPRRPAPILACLSVLLLAGCGSKVNEANYYRVGVGTSDEKVEEWLGPGRPVTVQGAPQNATAKQWVAGELKITILFENGKVIARKAEGLSGGKTESFDWPDAATRPSVPEGRPPKNN